MNTEQPSSFKLGWIKPWDWRCTRPEKGQTQAAAGASAPVRMSMFHHRQSPASVQRVAVHTQTVAQEQLRGTLRHSPPHRQFLIHRCSHCFTAVVLLGDFSMVTQPHLGNQGLLPVLGGDGMPPDPSLPKPGRTQGHNQGPPQAPIPQIAGCLVCPGGKQRPWPWLAALTWCRLCTPPWGRHPGVASEGGRSWAAQGPWR